MWTALASVALVVLGAVAWALWRRLATVERVLADLRLVRRELEQLTRDAQRALALTRQHLAEVAAGTPPPRDVIVEGRAWRQLEPAPALLLWERDPQLFVLDVRTPAEFQAGHVPGALNVPVDELRQRLGEVPRDKPLAVCCGVGLRAYVACRILQQRGFKAANVSGGYKTYRQFRPERP